MNKKAQAENKIIKRYTSEEAKRIVADIFRDSSDPEQIFQDIAENLLPQLTQGTAQESERAKNWLLGKSDQAQMTMGLEHHYPLLDTADKRYGALLLNTVRQIEKEYGCTSAVEKMVAESIGMAHIKIIDQSRRLNELLDVMSHGRRIEVAREVEALSRQIDRATRQFYTALTILKQIKHPQLEVNIVNRNTFVAQNQQINATSSQS